MPKPVAASKRKSVQSNAVKQKVKRSKIEEYPSSGSEGENQVDDEVDSSEEEDELDDSEDSDSGSQLEGKGDFDTDSDSDSESEDVDVDGDAEKGNEGKTTKESRAEQKRLREERKLGRPNGPIIQQIKKVWEKLRVKRGLSTDERSKLADEGWSLAKGQAKDLVLKHDASRVIQTILKYSSKTQKEEITKALRGTYYELSKSSYGKYLVVKMLHYGSKDTRTLIINELHGNFRKLMKHREGAYVIEDTYREYASPAQKRQMIREFYGNEYSVFRDSAAKDEDLKQILTAAPEKRPILLRNLNNVITSAVNKGSIGFQIIHAAMLEYVKNIDPTLSEKDDFIDLISEQFPEIVHTPEGAQVATRVLSMATAKERKGLIKALKPFASKMALDEYGQFVLISLFNTVDDTVLVSKSFTTDFKDNLEELVLSKPARRAFVYLLSGRTTRNCSPTALKQLKQVDEWKSATSKKDDEIRRIELKKAFSPLLLQGVIEFTKQMLSESTASQLLAEVLLHADAENQEQLDQASTAVINTVIENPDLISEQAYLGRVLRSLIQNGHWSFSDKKVEAATNELGFADRLSQALLENKDVLKAWSLNEGAFVVVALLENGSGVAELKKEVQKLKKQINGSDNKGSKLILEVLVA